MLLNATGASAGYDSTDVLHAVDIEVNSGEFVGLVGPNGCGKSTLLRLLTSILPCRAGTVELDGAPVHSLSALQLARKLSFVPQMESAAFDFTVLDVVLMGRYPHRQRFKGESEADYSAARRALEEADIAGLEDRPITRLSGGEYRRVLVARALAQEAPLMLLDEPTAHLDVTHQAELLDLVARQVRTKGAGALAALHDLNSAAEYCDRLVLMQNGRIVSQGRPAQVLTADNMHKAYGAQARIGRNPITGRPLILSLKSLRSNCQPHKMLSVHLICGGGSGIHVIHALIRAGYTVTAGVLNEGDTDWETARGLGVEMAVEAPFSPISPAARNRAATMAARADVIIIADMPFGTGNLANLEIAVDALTAGKKIVLVGQPDSPGRDYTGGIAASLIGLLMEKGATSFDSIDAWIASG